MKKKLVYTVIIIAVSISFIAWLPLSILTDPLVRMPGTQPNQGVTLEAPNRCLNCHAEYDHSVEPGFNWHGSMMAQAARDPIFFACMTVALQDSIWAVGNANAGDLCNRCHFPQGWLAGRSDPANASAMTGSDFDGIHCDFCHNMYDPFFETTYAGTREGNNWIGYWDEAGNTGPTSGTLSQTSATATYQEDKLLAQNIKLFSGDNFYTKFNVPLYATYQENLSGQYFVSGNGQKRASFADAAARHQMLYSRYHKSRNFCATCHDVSNPVLANLGLSGLPDQSGGTHQITEQYSACSYFHVERTFSEFSLSSYGRQGGSATSPEFAQQSGGIAHAARCQDCHMRDGIGYGCNKSGAPLRPAGSTEHPASGMPIHDLTGGNAWTSYILASLDPAGPVYDPVNSQILSQGPAVLTLNLTLGETPVNRGAAMKAGSDRALDQLRLAAAIKDVLYDPYSGMLSFKVQNNTAHKLISGFPEGRRMFVNVKAFYDDQLIHEVNPYDMAYGTLRGLPTSPSSPAPGPNEAYCDELVYEVHPRSSLTGEDETFHFVLATGRNKDNRIPPRGFDINMAPQRLCEPVWHGVSDPAYFSAAEYAGGYDAAETFVVKGANKIQVALYYQGTSREYIEFLRNEINGTASTLASPTPSGQTAAYIVQTDPFFSKLKAWGNAIWDLWYHNHGLDGSGKLVPGIVPFQMTSSTLTVSYQPLIGDFEPDGDVDTADLLILASQWLFVGDLPADIGPRPNGDNRVDYIDFGVFTEQWLKIAP